MLSTSPEGLCTWPSSLFEVSEDYQHHLIFKSDITSGCLENSSHFSCELCRRLGQEAPARPSPGPRCPAQGH